MILSIIVGLLVLLLAFEVLFTINAVGKERGEITPENAINKLLWNGLIIAALILLRVLG